MLYAGATGPFTVFDLQDEQDPVPTVGLDLCLSVAVNMGLLLLLYVQKVFVCTRQNLMCDVTVSLHTCRFVDQIVIGESHSCTGPRAIGYSIRQCSTDAAIHGASLLREALRSETLFSSRTCLSYFIWLSLVDKNPEIWPEKSDLLDGLLDGHRSIMKEEDEERERENVSTIRLVYKPSDCIYLTIHLHPRLPASLPDNFQGW